MHLPGCKTPRAPILKTASYDPRNLRVHPGSFAGLTELSQHEADGREAQECERLAVQAFPIFSQSTASVEPCDGSFNNPALRQDGEPLCGIRTLHNLHVDLAHDPAYAALELRPLISAV